MVSLNLEGAVHPRVVVAIALVLALLGTLFNLPGRMVQAAAPKPDIVLFYIDDFAPYPARLWDDPSRTPELARFANHGLEFENAIASTPLCGPARAALLTGQYGHNNGVTQNDIKPYDPRNTLAPKLGSKGYKTIFIGKHINRLDQVYYSRKRMNALAKNWNRFDVIWRSQGAFYEWRQYRKSGTTFFGSDPTDHSSYQASRRAVEYIRATPRNKPIFMVVSLFDGHTPMTPLKQFENDPKCQGIGGWSGPAYDEADVSDKPAFVRAHDRLGPASYDLQARCEQLLTVDWVIGNVRQALADTGRQFDTLQVLTADNGWLMGDHRLEGKSTPYSVDVPLYMRWPKVIGYQGRSVKEPVSNVDLAKTFCALAGCSMRQGDGKSLLPLIRGNKSKLRRDFLWAEVLHAGPSYGKTPKARPAWSGLHTTYRYDDHRWAYTKYRTGKEELYDLTRDPHRLDNLAGKSAHKKVLSDMRRFWRGVWNGDGVAWRSRMTKWSG